MSFLSVPILQVGDTFIAAVQVVLHDAAAVQFRADLLQRIYASRVRGVVLDLTAITVVDRFLGSMVGEIAQMTQLMGARLIITGLQPAVAITLIELGLDLRGVETALNLEQGLTRLSRSAASATSTVPSF